jgi:hypothetical protein
MAKKENHETHESHERRQGRERRRNAALEEGHRIMGD